MKKDYIYLITFVFLTLVVIVLGSYIGIRESQFQNEQNTLINDYESRVESQKSDKDQIRNLWDEQASNNDRFIIAEQNVREKTENYIRVFNSSIRFINTVPQLLDGADQKIVREAENELRAAQAELDAIIEENVNDKTESTEIIDSLYLQAGEDQPNRANPRDGTR